MVESPQDKTLDDKIFIILLQEKRNSHNRKVSEGSSIYFEEESIIEKNESHDVRILTLSVHLSNTRSPS